MPFSGSDITLSISFQIASDRRSGVAVIQNTTDYVSFGILLSNVTSTITLEFPDGMSTTAPAIVLNTATQTSIPLPIGADGYVMQTSSTTNYVYYSTDVVAGGVDPGTYGSSQYEAKLSCDQWIELTISTESNCFSGIVTATDTSPYYPLSPWVLVSRQLTLTPPTGLGGSPVHAPVVVSSATVSSSPHPIYTQQYTFTLNVTIQNGSVTQTLSTVKTYEVACGSICELVCMINTAFGQLSSAKSRGNIAETVRIWDVIQKGMAYIDAINYNINCSPSTIEGYTTAFKNLLLELGINTDCCGCGCSDDEPQVIYPQGGSGGTSISVTATPAPWLTYTYDSGTGTYTVILSQNAVDILTAARLYAFTSSDGSINISQSTSGSNPPTITTNLTAGFSNSLSFTVTKIANAAPTIGNIKCVGTKFNNTPTISEINLVGSGGIPWYFQIADILTNTATSFKAFCNLQRVNPADGFDVYPTFEIQEKMRINLIHYGIASPAQNTVLFAGVVKADSATGVWGIAWSSIPGISKEVDEFKFDVLITE